MQRNRPGTNNPINPLQKVAALTVTRNEDRIQKVKSTSILPIEIWLNFQKTSQMSGRAVDAAGESVTVRFSMAVRQATLNLTAGFAEGASPNAALMITDVAHQQPLVKATSVKSKSAQKRSAKGKIGAQIEASKKIGTQGKAKAGVALAGSAEASSESSMSQEQAYRKLTVTVTHQSNSVWWTVLPPDGSQKASLDDERSYLSGEVFMSEDSEDRFDACVIRRQSNARQSAIEIMGSVRVNMTDLIIEDVMFTDKLGEKISANALMTSVRARLPETAKELSGIAANSLRSRIMKEIVRRHLRDEGLSVEGADVEICRSQD